MAERKRVGIIFSLNDNWIGGSYYIMNLIHALNALDSPDKPHLVILHHSERDEKEVEKLDYPYLEFVKFTDRLNLFDRIVNKLSRSLFGKNLSIKPYPSDFVDVLFPATDHPEFRNLKKVYWIPDFQELHLPQFFSQSEQQARKEEKGSIINKEVKLVLSSAAARNDLNQFFPNALAHTKVINFAVTHPRYDHLDFDKLSRKYHLNDTYFFSPNQFWAHKNHKVIVKAAGILAKKTKKFQIVFSGKEYDDRNPDYVTKLKAEVAEQGLDDQIRFLGFIDRADQLMIMKKALAVIQPSLFEGWSTVIEDAKAMNQAVIASNLKVHQEQLKDSSILFDPNDPIELAGHLEKALDEAPEKIKDDYQIKVKDFGKEFMSFLD